MGFFRNLLDPQGAAADAYKQLAEMRRKMRALWCNSSSWETVYMDLECEKMLVDADIDKAEEFIAVLKASPEYQRRLCEKTKEKLAAKRAEVLALEQSLTEKCL